MPTPVDQAALAASFGHDAKRDAARRAIARDFFSEHLLDAEGQLEWESVRRAMQCIDFGRAVQVESVADPSPRALPLPADGPLGRGFFAAAAKDATSGVWLLLPGQACLRFYAPHFAGDTHRGATETLRYFAPLARRAGVSAAAKQVGA